MKVTQKEIDAGAEALAASVLGQSFKIEGAVARKLAEIVLIAVIEKAGCADLERRAAEIVSQPDPRAWAAEVIDSEAAVQAQARCENCQALIMHSNRDGWRHAETGLVTCLPRLSEQSRPCVATPSHG